MKPFLENRLFRTRLACRPLSRTAGRCLPAGILPAGILPAGLLLAGILLAGALLPLSLSAQTDADGPAGSAGPAESPGDDSANNLALPAQFRQVSLGMSFQEAGQALQEDPLFLYRGQPDVSLLAEENRSLIQCSGAGFISRASFQFREEILVAFSLELNRTRIDYFTMYSHLVSRYGEPEDLNPSRAVWSGGEVRLSLEKPGTVKYIDSAFYQSLIEGLEREKSQEELLREDFLDEF